MTKVKIQPGSSVSCEQSENIERFSGNGGQILKPVEKFVGFRKFERLLVWDLGVTWKGELAPGNLFRKLHSYTSP